MAIFYIARSYDFLHYVCFTITCKCCIYLQKYTSRSGLPSLRGKSEYGFLLVNILHKASPKIIPDRPWEKRFPLLCEEYIRKILFYRNIHLHIHDELLTLIRFINITCTYAFNFVIMYVLSIFTYVCACIRMYAWIYLYGYTCAYG